MSTAVASPRFTIAKACLREMPTRPLPYPLPNPECSTSQFPMLGRCNHRILEEGPGTSRIFIPGRNQHPLERADSANRFSCVRQSRGLLPSRKMFFQVGVLDARCALGRQPIVHPYNHVPSALSGVENARAVTESAGLGAQVMELSISHIEGEYRIHTLGDLLPVGPHILHRRAAHAAGNAAEALDPGTIARHRPRHESVPWFSRSHFESRLPILTALFNPAHRHLEREAWPAGIRDHQIAASSQHKEGKSTAPRECDARLHLGDGRRLQKKSRRTADLEGCQRRQSHIFLDPHGDASIYTTRPGTASALSATGSATFASRESALASISGAQPPANTA
jgi:hypothetical protein